LAAPGAAELPKAGHEPKTRSARIVGIAG
jgi:hypothetical protein